ncbi:MAG: hypothetical protein DHS20C08_07370 [Rhodomicrobium sp.]|nr:MAG: hypothetical protein DHS20C08_07370 [Rhodomicrobium sp.]
MNIPTKHFTAKSLSMLPLKLSLALLIAFTSLAVLKLPDAEAGKYKLKCKGQYQVVSGQLISTPPCEEKYLAHVARTYGFKVSLNQIRNNPHKKIMLCQTIGHDIRLSGICSGYGNIGPRPTF